MKNKSLSKSVAYSFSLIILMLNINSCSSSSKPEPEAKEIVLNKNEPSVAGDLNEIELYENAKKLYADNTYRLARDHFETLLTNYPSGPYASFAALKIADCDFETAKFTDAAREYLEVVESHPGATYAPYALYRAARSHQLVYSGAGRDPSPLSKAKELYERLFKDYPSSIYGETAKQYYYETVKSLGESENYIADFYQKMNNEKAADARKASINLRWPTKLIENNLAPSDLGPGATEILANDKKIDSLEEPREDLKAALSAPITEQKIDSHTTQLRAVQCSSEPQKVVLIELSDNASLAVKDGETIKSEDGKLKFKLIQSNLVAKQYDCFAKNDLSTNADGTLTIDTDQEGEIFTVQNPARVFITLE